MGKVQIPPWPGKCNCLYLIQVNVYEAAQAVFIDRWATGSGRAGISKSTRE